jgi:nitric oxide dioxygenase
LAIFSKGKRTTMAPDQVTLVQTSFAQVAPIADQAATMFYDRLFETTPQIKTLFNRDMAEQRRKLIAMLDAVVSGLGDLNSILPAASALAKRHVGYGVEAGHYVFVGQALLWTLERGLGPAWTKDVAAAWTAAYSVLSDFMIAEAYGRPAAAE